MNNNLKIGLFLTLVIITGTPASLALPQYLTNLNTVYGNGSCATCHVHATGGGSRTPYGTLFEKQPDHTINVSAALIAIGPPSGSVLDEQGAPLQNSIKRSIKNGNLSDIDGSPQYTTEVLDNNKNHKKIKSYTKITFKNPKGAGYKDDTWPKLDDTKKSDDRTASVNVH